MWMTTDCTSGRSINVAAEQTGGMTDLRFTQRSHWTLLYSSLVLILLHSVVLWLNGIAINWLLMLKINLLPKWSVQKKKPYCCYCRPVKPVPLQHLYVSTDSTVSFGSRQQSALQQFGFIIKAPATIISITVHCIIVCSGSRTSKESVSAICWCGVKMWIRTGVTETVVWLLNDSNGIKEHVEDISVDAVLGCKFCSVVAIYGANYNINNHIILTALSSPYHQLSTRFFKYSFTAHQLSQHVSSATLSSGR